jgi:hypothetical protein
LNADFLVIGGEMTDSVDSLDERRPRVEVHPTLSRDADGRVKRQRLVVVVDVVPTAEDYKLDVSVDSVPPSMIHKLKRFLLPEAAPQ